MDNSDMAYEPMDVDKSGSSNKIDISYNNSGMDDEVVVKTEKEDVDSTFEPLSPKAEESKPRPHTRRCHINVTKIQDIRKNNEKKGSGVNMLNMFIITFLFILFISITTHYVISFKCSDNFDLQYIKETLSTNVYGQSKAVNAIMEILNFNVSSKILFFYGGTGVGKTFATSLILGEYWKTSNVYHYTMPSFADTFSTGFMLGFTICRTSVLVVDDLTPSDMHIKKHISDIIMKSENLSKNITVILIFNCDNITGDFIKKCDDSFSSDLKESFDDVKAIKKLIKFNPLTEEHLRKCVEKELENKKMNGHNMDNILKNFNVTSDGCKGVYTKIKFLNII